MNDQVAFNDFREQWLTDVRAGNPSTVELGHRFAHKIFTQWRDIDDGSDDLIYCDGPNDGGLDLAYLERGETSGENASADIWFLVQSKYGSSFQGKSTLLQDGQKIVDSIAIGQERLSEISGNVLERVKQFLAKADPEGHGDRLMLVFATELPLDESERRALDDLRAMGQSRFGVVFDVNAISIETIYQNQADTPITAVSPPIRVPIEAMMADSGKDLKVGAIPLLKLYDFLKAYRAMTENLDLLYEKNVRLFLGRRGRVNKGMQATLNEDPAQFGLYNNGITIVVRDFEVSSFNTYILTDPYVVNGCQTTRTLWEIFRQKLESGGKGTDPKQEEWVNKAKDGVVVAKIVRVGNVGGPLLDNITKYTNSQNAVKEQDFVTLSTGFQHWKHEMAARYNVFLEVQRGGWESQQAWQNQNPTAHKFVDHTIAFDLLKVYGAGWLREAGSALGSNKSFVPGGSLYRKIVERETEPFSVDDLYAAYLLQKAADVRKFGRGSEKASRRKTRYLFYMVVMDLLRDVLIRANKPSSVTDLTQALLRLHQHEEANQVLYDAGSAVVDEYLTQGEEDSLFEEPAFKDGNDLSVFLKSEQLGKGEHTPNFVNLMAINKRTMGRGSPSPRDLITSAIG